MKYITIINVVSKLIFTILIFLLIKEEGDYIYVPILNGLGLIVGAVISLVIIYKKFQQPVYWYSWAILKHYFRESSTFFLSRVSVTIYTASNVFILGLFTNNIIVGYYSLAEKLYKALLGIFQPMVQVLYPYISKEKNIGLFKKLFFRIIIVNIMGIILLYFSTENIFELLFSQQVGIESLEVFHILLLSVFVIVPSMLLGYPFLGALGFTNYANLSIVYGSIFHLIGLVMLMLLDSVNIYSVAMMLVGTELLVFLLRIYWIKRNELWAKR